MKFSFVVVLFSVYSVTFQCQWNEKCEFLSIEKKLFLTYSWNILFAVKAKWKQNKKTQQKQRKKCVMTELAFSLDNLWAGGYFLCTTNILWLNVNHITPPPALNHNKINTIAKHFVNACVFTLFQPYLITLNFR